MQSTAMPARAIFQIFFMSKILKKQVWIEKDNSTRIGPGNGAKSSYGVACGTVYSP